MISGSDEDWIGRNSTETRLSSFWVIVGGIAFTDDAGLGFESASCKGLASTLIGIGNSYRQGKG